MQYWKKLKTGTEADCVSTKYLMKNGKQGNLTTYFTDYAMLWVNKTQYRNGQKAAPTFSLRMVTLESLRTTEA